MQIKTTMRFHFTSTWLVVVKQADDNKCWQGYGEMWTLIHCWWEHEMAQMLWKTIWWFLKMLKSYLYDLAIPIPGFHPPKTKHVHTKTCMWMFLVVIFITASVQVSISGWMDKQNVVTQTKGTVFYSADDTCCNTGESLKDYLRERSQSITKDHR